MRSPFIKAATLAVVALACATMAGPAFSTSPAQAAAKAVKIQGYLTAAPSATTGTVTLTVQTRYHGQISVVVNANSASPTKIVRRYNGASALDEMSANDVLQVTGTTVTTTTINATYIKDMSIQVAYTRLAGMVTAVSSNAVAVVAEKQKGKAPFASGENIRLPIGAGTEVISGTSVVTGTTSTLAVNDTVLALGVYNRVGHKFNSTFRIRILKHALPKPQGNGHLLDGYLVSAPATTTAPTTLTVQSRYYGVFTVSVSSSTTIVRRYGGASGLDEFSPNDVLHIVGTVGPNHTFTASKITDVSIQAKYTRLVGQVTAVTPSSVSVVVGVDRLAGRTPFQSGENVTLPVGASTQVIAHGSVSRGSTSAITMGAHITALGIFNRVQHTFDTTFRIRVL